MKKIISLVMACALLLGLCACGGEPTRVGSASDFIDSNAEPPATGKQVFKLGDAVELDGITVSFVDVITSTGADFSKPEEGNVFVLCEFEIANNSKEELAVSSMMSFEAYCDGYTCDYSLSALLAKGNKSQLDGSVAAGKKMRGVVGYEVPADWQELEIQYTIDLLKGSKIVFVASND